MKTRLGLKSAAEKAALYHCHRITRPRRREAEAGARKCLLSILRTGTHRGHNKVFLAAPRTHPVRPCSCGFSELRLAIPLSLRKRGWSVCVLSGDPVHDGAGLQNSCLEVLKCESVCVFLYAVAATLSCFRVTAAKQVGRASIRFICYLIDYPELTE